jgi:hypothetical protein
MRSEVNIREISSLIQSIAVYGEMASHLGQLGTKEQTQKMKDHFNTYVLRGNGTWGGEIDRRWETFDIHFFSQMWGNTSGGRQTIGGSAMTSAYTTIIENRAYGLAFIFYYGNISYICVMDDLYNAHRETGFKMMPGNRDCVEKLTVLYRYDG